MDDGELEVISWDGEGWGLRDHRYGLLANSLGSELWNPEGIHTVPILDLLWRTHRSRPGALHVVYGARYDFEEWIRWIDREAAEVVKRGQPVKIGVFTFRYNGLWFELWRDGGSPLTVWDVWRFWNCGFEDAVKKTFPDDPDLPLISEGKERRRSFGPEQREFMSRYNRAECRLLVDLMRQFFRDMVTAGIPWPAYPTGAGAIAGSMCRKYGVDKHVGDPSFGNEQIYDAVLRAYAAGRIESWQIGHHLGPGVQHDLKSAYGSGMVHLPSMRQGRWEWRSELSPDWEDRMSVWLVSWSWTPGLDGRNSFVEPCTERYFPFFYRTEKGSILYPSAGSGWQWWPEVVQARALGWNFTVHGGWVWRTDEPTVRPYGWIHTEFAKRAAFKARGELGPDLALKHGLAAVYGKACQARGALKENPPRFHNLAWAGWTTSWCRAKVMGVAHQAPSSVVYVMTDSVMATQRLRVHEGTELGQWEVTEYDRLLVAQAGVGSTWRHGEQFDKYRGFDPETVTAEAILEAWKENYESGLMVPMQTYVRRPVVLGQALQGENFERWGSWEKVPRDLQIYGGDGKRLSEPWQSWRPWERLYPLEPTPLMVGGESGATALSWLDLHEYLVAHGRDPLSAPYQVKWATEDARSLPEVPGRLREHIIVEEDPDEQ